MTDASVCKDLQKMVSPGADLPQWLAQRCTERYGPQLALTGGVFNRQQSGQTPGTGRVSAFREALLARGHGEWAFHADGRHVRVAREAPLQLSSVNPFAIATPGEIAEAPVVVETDDDDVVLRRFETESLADETLEVLALASAGL